MVQSELHGSKMGQVPLFVKKMDSVSPQNPTAFVNSPLMQDNNDQGCRNEDCDEPPESGDAAGTGFLAAEFTLDEIRVIKIFVRQFEAS